MQTIEVIMKEISSKTFRLRWQTWGWNLKQDKNSCKNKIVPDWSCCTRNNLNWSLRLIIWRGRKKMLLTLRELFKTNNFNCKNYFRLRGTAQRIKNNSKGLRLIDWNESWSSQKMKKKSYRSSSNSSKTTWSRSSMTRRSYTKSWKPSGYSSLKWRPTKKNILNNPDKTELLLRNDPACRDNLKRPFRTKIAVFQKSTNNFRTKLSTIKESTEIRIKN